MTMNELEEICMSLDGNIKEKVLDSRKLLASLPSIPRDGYNKWSVCLLACESCGAKDSSAYVADAPNMWCSYCGKMTYWKLTHRLN